MQKLHREDFPVSIQPIAQEQAAHMCLAAWIANVGATHAHKPATLDIGVVEPGTRLPMSRTDFPSWIGTVPIVIWICNIR